MIQKPDENAKTGRIFEDMEQYGFTDIAMKLYYASRTYGADEYIMFLETMSDHRSMKEAAFFSPPKNDSQDATLSQHSRAEKHHDHKERKQAHTQYVLYTMYVLCVLCVLCVIVTSITCSGFNYKAPISLPDNSWEIVSEIPVFKSG